WGHFLVYASKGKIFLTAAEKSKEICPERLEELGHVKSVFPGRILWYSNRHKHYEEILSSGAYDNI
ncbi:hypothetical protein KY325_02200, partial [Candidatus Woesearchaeota archaeon]|nr:hypothetical protein [Candidatus Woesearchaeota archaeon]